MSSGSRRAGTAAIIGVAGTVTIAATLMLLGESLPATVPALLLLVPVAVSSAVASWRIGVPVAVLSAVLYGVAFIPPVGGIHITLVEDAYVLAAFLAVSLAIGALTGRRPDVPPEPLLDEHRAMLLRSVSHDLRTPLSTIQTVTTDLADEDAYDPGTRRELMTMVAGEADRLNRIVGNLLSMSRVQAGSFQPELEPTEVEPLIRASIERFGRATKAIGVTIVPAVPPLLPDALADPVQVDQVLTNLVENAVRHAPPGSDIEVGARAAGDVVRIWVSDEGPGFTTTHRIGHDGQRPSNSGTGLGLTVCRAIVDAHGGTIEVIDRGDGARVEFTLPAAPDRAEIRSSSGNMTET